MAAIRPLPSHLSSDREIHIVISVQSGTCKAQEYYDSTLSPFLDSLDLPQTPSIHKTTSAKSIINLTRTLFLFNARRGVKQTIFLLSGDGGMVDIVNTLATHLQRSIDDSRPASIFVKPTICLIPMGTANALAWSSGVASDPIGTILQGQARPLPMFMVKFSPGARLVVNEGQDREEIGTDLSNDSSTTNQDTPTIYGAVVASWGLHASLVSTSDTREYRQHGVARFRMAAQELLKESHEYRGRVLISSSSSPGTKDTWRNLYPHPGNDGADDDSDAGRHAYILTTLVSNLEEKFRISPSSKPPPGDDEGGGGNMYVVAFKPLPSEKIVEIINLAYDGGKHVDEKEVVYERVRKVRVEVDEYELEERWRHVCVDGKIVVLERGGWMQIEGLPGGGVEGRRVVELVC